MEIKQITEGLQVLGDVLLATGESRYKHLSKAEQKLAKKLDMLITHSAIENPWFTERNIRYALLSNAFMLSDVENLKPFSPQAFPHKTLGIVPAGLAPLDGLKDTATALLSGFKVQVKQMFKEEKLMPAIVEILLAIHPGFKEQLQMKKQKLAGFDKVIVTIPGGRNEQWHKYFSKYPGRIRTHSHSAGIITGKETLNQIENIANDIFRYFGRTADNVHKLYLPSHFKPEMLFEAFEPFGKELKQHTPYFNNFEYNKSIYLINKEHNKDNGFVIFKEDAALNPRTAVIHMERYENEEALEKLIERDKNMLKQIVSIHHKSYVQTIPPGEALKPKLNDTDAQITKEKINN
ncbi:MAG: hypothetical protein R6U19_05505 [Bacteroidales bacterium]